MNFRIVKVTMLITVLFAAVADGSAADISKVGTGGTVAINVNLDPGNSDSSVMPAALKPGLYWGKAPSAARSEVLKLTQNSARLGLSLVFNLLQARITEVPDLQALVTKLNTEQGYWDIAENAVSVLARGGVPNILIFGVPEYLSSCPGTDYDPGCPPVSQDGFRDMVQAIVTFFGVTAGLGNRVAYEIWNEPDVHYWTGTHQEYFETYKSAIWGALRAHIDAGLDDPPVVGGPSVSWPTATVETSSGSSAYYLAEFFDYIANTPLVDAAFGINLERLPLDFVSHHQYTHDAYRTGMYTPLLRQWLADSGLDPATPIVLTEWGQWWRNKEELGFSDPFYERLDDERNAAHVIASVIWMEHYGVDRHNLSTLSDFVLQTNGPNAGLRPQFHGSEALFTYQGIEKPTFNGLRLLDVVSSLPIRSDMTTDHNQHFVLSLSGVSEDGSKAAILLVNWIPERMTLYNDLLNKWLSQQYKQNPEQALQTLRQLQDPAVWGELVPLLNKIKTVDELRDSSGDYLAPATKSVLNSALDEMWSVDPFQTMPVEVALSVKNAPLSPQRLYRVDQLNANSHTAYMAHWAEIGLEFTDFGDLNIVSGNPDLDDEKAAIRAAYDCAPLLENGWQPTDSDGEVMESIELPPNSLVLITFSDDALLDVPDMSTCSHDSTQP